MKLKHTHTHTHTRTHTHGYIYTYIHRSFFQKGDLPSPLAITIGFWGSKQIKQGNIVNFI